MKKLKLNVDALAVESFQPGEAATSPGTVEGHDAVFAATRPQACDPFSLPPRCA